MTDPHLQAAAAEAERALAGGSADPYDLLVAGLGASDRGDDRRADELIEAAYRAAPDDPSIATGLAVRRRQQGRLSEAVRLCDAAIAMAADYPDAWLERGAILAAGGSSKEASRSFAQAARLAPGNADAHAGLASQAARDGDLEVAEASARRALAIAPENPVAAAALGSVLIERGDAAEALPILRASVAASRPGQSRSVAANVLGRVHERLDEHAEAFAAFALSNADFAEVNAAQAAGRGSHTDFVEAISAALADLGPVSAEVSVPDRTEGRAPVHLFLIGYPRSGTTMLENVLASLAGVSAIEEWPSLRAADLAYLGGETGQIGGGLESFMAAPPADIRALQAAYWQQAAAGGRAPGSRCLVDMDPLKATRLPFIARMFPSARVIVMRRDPRDVVWSCFRTSFAATSGTLEYVTLERTARHYDAMMRLTDLACERLPVSINEVYYERLVRDFDAQTRAICAFAGLDWSDDVRRFDRTAGRRGVTTASAGQVRKGLYDGSGQWRPYARWLEPVRPILQPWIDRFGYPDD